MATITTEFNKNLINEMVTITSALLVVKPTPDGNAIHIEKQTITAIPLQ